MAHYRLHPHLTPGRRAWLERLHRGPAKRGRGPVGFQCMTLGWTQWLFRRGEQTCARADIEAEYGNWHAAREAGWMVTELETLTPEGRRMLERAERGA